MKRSIIIAVSAVVVAALAGGSIWYFRKSQPAVAAAPVPAAVPVIAATVTGKDVPIVAQSICVHSDTPNAVEVAQAVHRTLSLQLSLATSLSPPRP